MMAFRHGKNTVLFYNGADLTSYFNEATVSQSVETAETSAFGSDAKTYVPGLQDGTISGSGMFDGSPQAIDVILSGVIGAEADDVVTMSMDGPTVGNVCHSLLARETSYEISSPVGDVVAANLEAQGDGGIERGIFLAVRSATGSTGNGTGQDNGAASSAGGSAYLHVTANSRDDASTFKVQHSTDNVSYVDLATFSTVSASATSGQRVAVSGTVYQYVRAYHAPGGSSGSVTYTMAFARN